MNQSDERASLRVKINGETSRMPFAELMRFFASGAMVAVSDELDLVEVAVSIALDDTAAVQEWMRAGRLARVSDAQAEAWMQKEASLWTVVVKPWILVQEHALRERAPASSSVN
jgi:hypothetical protein